MKFKIFIFMFLLILSLGFSSSWTSDNFIKEKNQDLQLKNYGNYEIIEHKWWDILKIFTEEKIKEVKLKENTEQCSDNCFAIKEITNLKPSSLIEDIRFFRDFGDGEWVLWDKFSNWDLLVENKNRYTEEPIYKLVCNKQNCSSVIVETRIIDNGEWIKYDWEKEDYEGTYKVKLIGSKKPSTKLDWQIKFNGIWSEEWAVWGNISEGDDAEVILNEPINSGTEYANLINFNATGNISAGAYVINAKLYTNETGSWGIRNITYSENGTLHDPDAVTNPTYAFDRDDSTRAEKTTTTTIELGHTFENRSLGNVRSKGEGNVKASGSGTTNWGYYVALQGYDGSTWTNISILKQGSGSYTGNQGDQITTFTYDNTTEINAYWQGIRTAIDSTNGGGGGETYKRFYSIEYADIPANSLNYTTEIKNTYNPNDNILWNIQFCDSDGDCGFANSNFSFIVDSSPPTIEIFEPEPLVDYAKVGGNLSLNFTATDDNLNSCWYEYNSINSTVVGCQSGTSNSTNITLTTQKNIILWANDTAGNINSTTTSWDYNLLETGQEYQAEVYETESTEFKLNLTYNNSFSLTTKLNYDGENYSAVNIGSGSSGIFVINGFSAPVVEGTTNKTFYWILDFNGTLYFTEETNQSVVPLIISQCNGTYTQQSLNFTFIDELNFTLINATATPTTIKLNFNYWVGDENNKKNYSFQNLTSSLNNYQFCINTNDTIQLDMDMQYSTTEHIERTYYFRNLEINNESQDILLYNLLTTESTKFEIDLRYGTSQFTEALVEVWKYFVGLGEYKKIFVGLTDDKGSFVANIDLDQTYDFKVYRDDTSYGTFNKQASCSVSPCEIEFNIEDLPIDAFEDFYEYFAENVDYNLTYNTTTKIINLTFNDLLGTAQYWRLYVYQYGFSNDTINTICDEKSYSVQGSLTCNYSLYNGNVLAKVYISRSPEKLVDLISLINNNIPSILGASAILVSIIILLVFVFAGIRNPVNVLVLIPVALVILKLLGFMPLGWITISGITIFAFWLIKRLNT